MRSFPPSLQDDGVRLRPWRADDADDFARAWQDKELTYRFPVSVPFTAGEAAAWIAQMGARWQQGTQAAFAVHDSANNALLGGCDLDDIDDPPGTGDLGYWLAPEARGRGLATCAARLLVDWSFQGLGLERLTLHVEPDNAPSIALAQRLAFSRGRIVPAHASERGRLRDMVVFDLTAARCRSEQAPSAND